MSMRTAVVTALFALAVPGPALANGNLTKIEASPASATLDGGKATVKFTLSGTAESTDNCGFWVDYGDGQSPDTRILSSGDGLFPRTLERSFVRPGTYKVAAKGQRVKTTLGCQGEVSTTVTIAAASTTAAAPAAAAKGAPAAKAAAAAPSCPEGWKLDGAADRKTGAFACNTQPPAKKLECGPGLKYFEKSGQIGCRK